MGASDSTISLIRNYRNLTAEIGSTSYSASELSAKTVELEHVKRQLIAVSNGVITAADLENGAFDRQLAVLVGATESERKYQKYQLQRIVLEKHRRGRGQEKEQKPRKVMLRHRRP